MPPTRPDSPPMVRTTPLSSDRSPSLLQADRVTNGAAAAASTTAVASCTMIINGPTVPFQSLTAASIPGDLCPSPPTRGGRVRTPIRIRRRPSLGSRSRFSASSWSVPATAAAAASFSGRRRRPQTSTMQRQTLGPAALAEQVDNYNRRVQQEAFRVRLQDDGSYAGVLRFQLEQGENRVVKAVRVQSGTTVDELVATLLDKFNVDMRVPDGGGGTATPKVSLLQVTGDGELILSGTDCPLQRSLELDVVPRFVLRVSAPAAIHSGDSHSTSPTTKARHGSGGSSAGGAGGSLARWLMKKPFAIKLMNSELAAHLSLRRKGDHGHDGGTASQRSYSTVDRRQLRSSDKKVHSMFLSSLREGGEFTDNDANNEDANGGVSLQLAHQQPPSHQLEQKLKSSRSLEDLTDLRGRARPDATERRRQKIQRVKSIAAAQSMSNMLSIDSQAEKLRVHVDPGHFGRRSVDVRVDGNTTAEQIVQQVAKQCLPSDGTATGDDDDAPTSARVAAFAEGHVLCDVVGRQQEGIWLTDYARPMADDEKPLMLLSLMKPSEGFSRRFELRPCATPVSPTGNGTTAMTTSGVGSRLHPAESLKVGGGKQQQQQPQQPKQWHGGSFLTAEDRSQRMLPAAAADSVLAGVVGGSPGGRATDTLKFPKDRPYLLTVNAFDHENDPVLHPIDEGVTVFGCDESPRRRQQQRQNYVALHAPDVLPMHCRVRRLTGRPATVTIEPASEGAVVKVNGLPVSAGGIPLKPTDLIALGEHYVFIFKDPTQVPVSGAGGNGGRSGKKANGSMELATADQHRTGKSGHRSNELSGVVHSIDSRNKLSYRLDCEDELIEKILDIMSPTEDGFKLTPAHLFAFAVEHSHVDYGKEATQRLILKISNALQGIVWDSVKALSGYTIDLSRPDPCTSVEAISRGLRPVLFWMANCSEVRSFFSINLPRYFGRMASVDVDELSAEICSAVEETVTYGFQQTVYYLTKAVYPHLDIILTSNPFGDPSPEECTVKDIIKMLELVESMCEEASLSREIAEQLLCYLYFFIGTCLFNTVVESGTDKHLCTWDVGVKLRKNLETLETWANEHGCENGVMYLDKIISVADLLSTSKQFLVQTHWSSLRELFPHLGAAQLKRVLDLYELGLTRSRPECWQPTAEDAKRAEATDRVPESFDNHPPLLLPSTTSIDPWQGVHDSTFYDYLDYINACFELSDDGELSCTFSDQAAEAPFRVPADHDGDSCGGGDDEDDVSLELGHGGSPKPAHHGSPLLARRGKQQQSSNRSSDLPQSPPSGGSASKNPQGYNPLFKKRGTHHQRTDSGSSTASSIDGPSDTAAAVGRLSTLTSMSLGDSGDVAWDRELIAAELLGGKKKKKQSASDAAGSASGGRGQQLQRFGAAGDLSALPEADQAVAADSSGSGSSSAGASRSRRLMTGGSAEGPGDGRHYHKSHAAGSGQMLRDDSFDESEMGMLLEEDNTLPESHKAALSAFLRGEPLDDLQDDLVVIELDKGPAGLGFGIVDGLYTLHCHTGIYVKQLVPDGPAQRDSQLKLGYRILAINGRSLASADFQSAFKIIKEAGSHVRLLAVKSSEDVAKKIGLPMKS